MYDFSIWLLYSGTLKVNPAPPSLLEGEKKAKVGVKKHYFLFPVVSISKASVCLLETVLTTEHSRGLKLDDHCGPFQPRTFYDSMIL